MNVLGRSGSLLVLIGVLMWPQSSKRSATRLTVSEAEALARASLSRETKTLPGLVLFTSPPAKKGSQCVTFDVLWTNPAAGSTHVQFITVDLASAQVLRPMTCEEIRTGLLRSVQEKVRMRHRIPSDQLELSSCCP